MAFQKRKENFKCEKCGEEVVGNGYTNHCPKCLWSKHVDIKPGDRMNTCQGIMEPIGVWKRKDKYILIHKCLKCGEEKNNEVSPADNFDEVLKISKKQADKLFNDLQ
jgi:DNA-directed RNA polymerase subunit RPC12/RpoP